MKKHVLLAAITVIGGMTAALAQEKEVIKKGDKEITITKEGDKETKVTVEVNEEKPSNEQKTESREIIIQKNGDKETKMTLEIIGDKVIINGKPMNEFKEDGVKIKKKKMIIVNGEPLQENIMGDELPENFSIQGWGNMDGNSFSINGNSNDMTTVKSDTVAFLGVQTEPVEKGVVVTEVVAGSAAASSGLMKDDIITDIDGETITDPQSLTAAIRKHRPKDQIKVGYVRNGKNKQTKVNLQEKIITSNIKKRVIIRKDDDITQPQVFGFALPEMDGFTEGFPFPKKQKLGIKIQDTEESNGVKVLEVEPGSAAEKAGLEKNDIVTEIGEAKISNTDDAREQLQENAEKSQYNIKVLRNGKTMSFEVKIPKKLKTADL